MHHVGYDHGGQDGAPAGLHDHHTQDLAFLLLYEDLKGERHLESPNQQPSRAATESKAFALFLPWLKQKDISETPTLQLPSFLDSTATAYARNNSTRAHTDFVILIPHQQFLLGNTTTGAWSCFFPYSPWGGREGERLCR